MFAFVLDSIVLTARPVNIMIHCVWHQPKRSPCGAQKSKTGHNNRQQRIKRSKPHVSSADESLKISNFFLG